jgi:hypothetical protein
MVIVTVSTWSIVNLTRLIFIAVQYPLGRGHW